jgi:hypothetical protein
VGHLFVISYGQLGRRYTRFARFGEKRIHRPNKHAINRGEVAGAMAQLR